MLRPVVSRAGIVVIIAAALAATNGSAQGPVPTAGLIAFDDSYSTPHNTSLSVTAPGVLANDNPEGGGTMTAQLVSWPPTHVVSLSQNGSLFYIPPSGFGGAAIFTYRASNTSGTSNLATVTVNVAPAPPVSPSFLPHPSSTTAYLGQGTSFFVGLLGTPTPTCQWQSSVDLGGSWTSLTNAPPYSGVTTSRLTVSSVAIEMSGTQFRCVATNTSGSVASTAATLTVALTAPGAPLSGAWTGTTAQARFFNFTVNGGTAVSPLSYSAADGCRVFTSEVFVNIPIAGNVFTYGGSPSGCPAPTVTGRFTAPTSALGTVIHAYPNFPQPGCPCTGTFQASWSAASPPAPLQFPVHPANQSPAPGQRAQFAVAASGSPIPALQWEMSQNAGSSWANVPAATPFSGSTSPTLTVVAGAVGGLNGTQFRARAQNASNQITSNTATLGMTAGGLPPTAVGDDYGTGFNAPLTVAAPGVLGNDQPNTGGAMSAALVSGPANGQATLGADGSFTYTPTTGFSGIDTFAYRAANGGGAGNVATVTITVAGPGGGPQPPTNFRVVAMAGNTITLAWSAPTSGSLPSGYQIEGGLAPGQVLGSLPLGTTPVAALTLPSGSLYLRMRTVAGGTSSGASNELLTHVNVPAPPSPPVNLLGLVVGDSLSLAWKNTFGGGVPTNVTLDVTGSLTGSAPLGAVETFSVAGVPAGTYTLSVRASNASGSSVASNAVTLTFPGGCSGAPLAPVNYLAYRVGATLFLTWDPPTNGPAPTGYVLNVTGAFVGAVPTPLRALSGAVPPGTYHLSVAATNACGTSAATTVQTVTTP